MPALAVNIIIVHHWDVVFPRIMMFTLSADNNCILFPAKQPNFPPQGSKHIKHWQQFALPANNPIVPRRTTQISPTRPRAITYKTWYRVVSPLKVSRFAPLNRYYIIIDEVFFDNFFVIIYLLVVCKKK